MKAVDRILQRWRIARARRYIGHGVRLLDIGCGDGVLFKVSEARICKGVGIDPSIDQSRDFGRYQLIAGRFPWDLPEVAPFDVITMLAVLEHIPASEYGEIAVACDRLLRPGGRLIITVPSPAVDLLLALMKFARLIDGMKLEEHHGFDPTITPNIFGATRLSLSKSETFQFGLNNLFLFQKLDEKSESG